jgi:hypothetical protein
MTTESTSTHSQVAREIKNLGMLDLTGMTSPDQLSNILEIKNVGAIIVPQTLMPALLSIPQTNVGTTIPIPDGKNVKVNTVMGPMQISGEGLAAPEGDGEHVLVVMGPLIITTPVEKVGYGHISVMGPVIAPKGSEVALASSQIRVMGPMQFYPTGSNIKVQLRDMKLSGKSLANPDTDGKDTLVVMGELLVTSPPQKVGYNKLIVMGMVIAPKESEELLDPHLDAYGSVVWYTGTPRQFNGSDRFSAQFFELLPEPITLILNGAFAIASDVTAELLRAKVTDIVLNGELRGPRHLVPLLQVLATEKNGMIEVDDGAEMDGTGSDEGKA